MDLQIPLFQTLRAEPKDLGKQESIEKAAQDFEAAYLGTTFSAMLAQAIPDPAGGHGEEMFRGLLANAMAQEVANSGGVGIARSIAAQLKVYSK
ncbi:rod-binding protein [Neptunicoccus cionae]|uniref:rod-binding protein n=1 Tax=Neptunicoccus cionae TaxID=2035344 RepID=UPI000C76E65D|nr:rod-binding protein [Amylibacter cionae]MBR9865214.1 hypothetical protein [Paracoccaceae bacterium]PLS21169.1 hypothetical protein C0U40_13565 [Amylibacter cionae]